MGQRRTGERSLAPEWGDQLTLQVSLISAASGHFPEVGLHYVFFPYSAGMFEDADLVEIRSISEVDAVLERAASQLEIGAVQDAVRRAVEAERDLRLLLETAGGTLDDRPAKFFWILDKPIADTARDFTDVSTTIAGFGESDTEISFCGHGEAFRAGSANRFVDQFGGNSYFVTDGADLAQTIEDDSVFYRRPAIRDLRIAVHSVGAVPDPTPLREYRLVSVGNDEHHVFMCDLTVPSRLMYAKQVAGLRGGATREGVDESFAGATRYPAAYVTVSYYDYATSRHVFFDRSIALEYTTSYADYMASRDPTVARNVAVLETYRLVGAVGIMLAGGNYDDPVLQIAAHIRELESVVASEPDDLVTEDIEMLRDYQHVILDNRDNPLRAIKAWQEIRRMRY